MSADTAEEIPFELAATRTQLGVRQVARLTHDVVCDHRYGLRLRVLDALASPVSVSSSCSVGRQEGTSKTLLQPSVRKERMTTRRHRSVTGETLLSTGSAHRCFSGVFYAGP
jgi:hypothetical protein